MPQVHKTKVLNPKSRKAARKINQFHQKERRELKHKITDSKQSLILAKIIWFKNHVVGNADKKCYSTDEVHEIVKSYLKRFDDEENLYDFKDGSLKIENSISIGVDITRMFVGQELNEYISSGLNIPDILSKAGVEYIKNWVPDKLKMQQINMIKIRQKKM